MPVKLIYDVSRLLVDDDVIVIVATVIGSVAKKEREFASYIFILFAHSLTRFSVWELYNMFFSPYFAAVSSTNSINVKSTSGALYNAKGAAGRKGGRSRAQIVHMVYVVCVIQHYRVKYYIYV